MTLQSRIESCYASTNDDCVPPQDYRVNLEKANVKVKGECKPQDPVLTLPVTDEKVAIVKFFNNSACNREQFMTLYAIRANSGECMKNFLNDSVAEGTRQGYIRVTCAGAGRAQSRISFFADNECTKRIASDIYTGPGYIELNDKCFQGTNYIRAYCQNAAAVNEVSEGEKFDDDCKKDPSQAKCQPEKPVNVTSAGFLNTPTIGSVIVGLVVVRLIRLFF